MHQSTEKMSDLKSFLTPKFGILFYNQILDLNTADITEWGELGWSLVAAFWLVNQVTLIA
jgi:hypothetical protein